AVHPPLLLCADRTICAPASPVMPKLTLASLDPPTAIGAPVMALGIFGAAALQRLHAGRAATVIVAAAAAIIWALLAVALFASIRRRGISAHVASPVASFGIGTWVAATAVVARMMMLAAPTLGWLARTLFFAAVVLWLWFLPIALRNFAWL